MSYVAPIPGVRHARSARAVVVRDDEKTSMHPTRSGASMVLAILFAIALGLALLVFLSR